MTPEQYAKDQENEAFGRFLIEAVAELFGCEPDPEKIDRRAYKETNCGASVQFDATGIVVCTIVEGTDAELTVRIDLDGVEMDDAGAELVRSRVDAALEECEDFAEEHFEGY